MNYSNYSIIKLASAEILSLEKTFECGQCFRWNKDSKDRYRGVAFGVPAIIWQYNNDVLISSMRPEIWYDYFDLTEDYEKKSESLRGINDYLDQCIDNGKGLRILRQDPWETLCSFIFSQCNNIPRIKTIVERFCETFGEKIEGTDQYTFPSPERVCEATSEELDSIRAGYRTAYIMDAARKVRSGAIDLAGLIDCDWKVSREALKRIDGVGNKVADCVNLFGLRHMEAFPVDVWIRRALDQYFPRDFDPCVLRENAGLAQQYIFYETRGR